MVSDPSDAESVAVRAIIHVAGLVQGVGYRAFSLRAATEQGLNGTVRNLDDGRVELDVEGPKRKILRLIEDVKKGPPASRVTAVEVEWGAATGRVMKFHIRH